MSNVLLHMDGGQLDCRVHLVTAAHSILLYTVTHEHVTATFSVAGQSVWRKRCLRWNFSKRRPSRYSILDQTVFTPSSFTRGYTN